MTPAVEELIGVSTVALKQKAATLIAQQMEEAEQLIGSYMQAKGLTAWPVCHAWVDLDASTGELSVSLREGQAPDDANLPEWLRHQKLDLVLKVKGTIRKRVDVEPLRAKLDRKQKGKLVGAKVKRTESFYLTKG